MKTFDFTTKRLGSIAGPYKRKIIVCGKCGKRGTDDGTGGMKPGFHSVTHTGFVETIAGMPFFHTREWCVAPVEPTKEAA
jgi:hypothetical protein